MRGVRTDQCFVRARGENHPGLQTGDINLPARAPDNAVGFYLRYFKEPVRNNSEIYNYYEWNAKNRATAAQHVKSDTREQPKVQQELEPVTVRFLPPSGGIIIFSGVELTAEVTNVNIRPMLKSH